MKMTFDQRGYNDEQKSVLADCINMNYDISNLTPDIDCFKMRLAYLAFKNGNDITDYLEEFDHDQLDEIRLGMMMKVDVKKYTNPLFSAEEMHLIRIALEDSKRLITI